MTDRELKKTMDALQKLAQEHRGSPEKARAFLIESGILDKSGKLSEAFEHGA